MGAVGLLLDSSGASAECHTWLSTQLQPPLSGALLAAAHTSLAACSHAPARCFLCVQLETHSMPTLQHIVDGISQA